MSLAISIAVPMALQRFEVRLCGRAFDWTPLPKSLYLRLAGFADIQVALLTSKTGLFGLASQSDNSVWLGAPFVSRKLRPKHDCVGLSWVLASNETVRHGYMKMLEDSVEMDTSERS